MRNTALPFPLLAPPRAARNASTVAWMAAGLAPAAENVVGAAPDGVVGSPHVAAATSVNARISFRARDR